MTLYIVHIYREMRLTYDGISASSHDEAARIARDTPTREANDVDDCEGESFGALVDVVGDEKLEHSRMIDFSPERQRKAAANLLAAASLVIERWESGDLAEAVRLLTDAIRCDTVTPYDSDATLATVNAQPNCETQSE